MIESSQEKKKIFYLVVLVLTLINMILGAVFGIYSLIASQKKDDTKLYTGTLQINYIDGVYIANPELIPTKNVDFSTYKGVYRNNFQITSSGTLDQIISITLEITKNEFKDNALKYAIYNSKGNELAGGFVPKSGKVNLANNMYLASGATATYTLVIWLDNTNYNQNSEMGKIITGKINAFAKQIKY